MRSNGVFVALLLLTTTAAYAGCFAVEAIHVPGRTVGELVKGSTQDQGFYIVYETDEDTGEVVDAHVEAYSAKSRRETRLSLAGIQHDRFLRPTDAVRVFESFAIESGEEFSYRSSSETIVERSSRIPLFTDRLSSHINMDGLSSGSDQKFRTFLKPSMEALEPELGDVAGARLEPGVDLHFQKETSFWGSDYHLELTYRYDHATTWKAATALVYEVVLTVTKTSKGGDERPDGEAPAVPKKFRVEPIPSHQFVWFTETCPDAVHAEWGGGFRFGGKDYLSKGTHEIETCIVGKDPIGWGQGSRLEPLPRNPAMGFVKFSDLGANSQTPTRHGLDAALRRLDANPTLTSYKTSKASSPLGPVVASYLPEPDHSTSTWTILWGQAAGSAAASRQTLLPLGVPVYQERALSLSESFQLASGWVREPLPNGSVEVARPGAATALAAKVLGASGDPALRLTIGSSDLFHSEDEPIPVALLTAARTKVTGTSGVVPEKDSWTSVGVVEVDLLDGGLASINRSRLSGSSEHPWISPPWPLFLRDPAGGAEGPMDRAFAPWLLARPFGPAPANGS